MSLSKQSIKSDSLRSSKRVSHFLTFSASLELCSKLSKRLKVDAAASKDGLYKRLKPRVAGPLCRTAADVARRKSLYSEVNSDGRLMVYVYQSRCSHRLQ